MTRKHTERTKEKTGLGMLLSGVSGIALLLGVAHGTARAAGITVTSNSVVPAVTVTTFSTVDFIDIDGGIVTNDITNEGTIGLTDVGIEVHSGGFVGGAIVNASKGIITATKTGIAVRSDTPFQDAVGGSIINRGLINVINPSAVSTSAIGINVTGSGILTSLSNAGTINVSLTGTGTGTHPAIGINVVSSGIINANISNSGEIDVDAFWGTGIGSQDAQATGVNVSNTTPSDSASGNASLIPATNAFRSAVIAFSLFGTCRPSSAFSNRPGASTVTHSIPMYDPALTNSSNLSIELASPFNSPKFACRHCRPYDEIVSFNSSIGALSSRSWNSGPAACSRSRLTNLNPAAAIPASARASGSRSRA